MGSNSGAVPSPNTSQADYERQAARERDATLKAQVEAWGKVLDRQQRAGTLPVDMDEFNAGTVRQQIAWSTIAAQNGVDLAQLPVVPKKPAPLQDGWPTDGSLPLTRAEFRAARLTQQVAWTQLSDKLGLDLNTLPEI